MPAVSRIVVGNGGMIFRMIWMKTLTILAPVNWLGIMANEPHCVWLVEMLRSLEVHTPGGGSWQLTRVEGSDV